MCSVKLKPGSQILYSGTQVDKAESFPLNKYDIRFFYLYTIQNYYFSKYNDFIMQCH